MRNALLLSWWGLTFFMVGLTLIGPRLGLPDRLIVLPASLWAALSLALLFDRLRRSR
jgi:hypothetical protein